MPKARSSGAFKRGVSQKASEASAAPPAVLMLTLQVSSSVQKAIRPMIGFCGVAPLTVILSGAVTSFRMGGIGAPGAILFCAVVLIFFSIVFCIVRLVIGRTAVDRVVAIDLLTVVTISLVVLYAHISGRFVYVDVALVYGLLSFLAVLAIARFLERRP